MGCERRNKHRPHHLLGLLGHGRKYKGLLWLALLHRHQKLALTVWNGLLLDQRHLSSERVYFVRQRVYRVLELHIFVDYLCEESDYFV